MAAISLGVVGYKSLFKKSLLCDGESLSMQKASGNGSSRASVSICSYGNYSENQKKNGFARKAVKPQFDFINKGLQPRWWIPLFRSSADKKWAEEGGSNEQSVESAVVQSARKTLDNERVIDEEEISARRRSKFVGVRFTPEKAKLLRKALRSTSSFHDLMYHSAIASRLASPDSSSDE
ncbi:uncharacterized protein LOC131044145 [Cryptomeria japonica]|uniref:uncharacterized protein LOC131044145 n=1 Tax=Cryptomeria japonica TaxID=3369 RepID=UPI0027DA2F14|nr:uncharacterized protein LOC131044145 [Cryptomeria japonica]